MRLVPIEFAKPGNYLAKTIFDNDGRILLREGVVLTEIFLIRIKRLRICSIYISDEYSEIIIEDVIKPELRQNAIKAIKETFYSFEKYNLYSNNINFNEKKFAKENHAYFESIGSIARDIIDEIISKKNVMISLVDIKSMDNYTYQHSVNVAVISLVLGVQLQLNQNDLYTLCMGALIHDIGKVLIPIDIVLKPGPLTNEEFEIIKEHTTKGYDYLKGCLDISAPSRIVALQHHEKMNGCGYPENIKNKSINRFARIVAIADVYDALTSDRPYRKAMNPNDAVEYILSHGDTQFDYEMVKAFSKAVVPYPPGTLVRLSTGDIGVVTGIFPNFALRPQVKIIKKGTTVNTQEIGETVSLIKQLDIVIENIEFVI
ncbi:HD-GYP domain-containing protein [Clostridium bowmanii]|uniref:HD-GYP domain-containing protein n=1 Tax=Clostridium bowmanii TaxID=132925 RepID=UPI001C0CEEA4|nr:HD-GYP domain-containing protein [Clostridium bowmanii]MBU3190133.1 HD-GYP domain-containing protein [Clostridium bowmanii]MCA1074729.1 HD-GYP domain-containing protein [Clostridium bowmanii]